MKTAYLILENGIVFNGQAFGAEVQTLGEIVFTTAMTGYLETLTDPSYYGQIVLQIFPLIGNYGVIPDDFESDKIALSAYIVKYPCDYPSNFRSIENLDSLLKKQGIAGLCGIDTRMLTKIIRNNGVLNGKITYTSPTEEDRLEAAHYKVINPIKKVSYKVRSEKIVRNEKGGGRKIALLDYGAKGGIEDALIRRGCQVQRFNYAANAEEIMHFEPCGIVLSNGPGDPSDPANQGMIDTVRELDNRGVPIMGICLGHQLLALARGYKTHKMKFGHRGANQAVKDMATGRVYITSQNHGYAVTVDKDLPLNQFFINVNDGTNEGIDYGLSFSVQFHPEAQGGPLDTSFLFCRFLERINKHAGR